MLDSSIIVDCGIDDSLGNVDERLASFLVVIWEEEEEGKEEEMKGEVEETSVDDAFVDDDADDDRGSSPLPARIAVNNRK